MRNISFALTTQQVRARTKTVTRRRGTWWSKVLKPGQHVCAVVKSQGIKAGKIERLGVLRIVSVTTENLCALEDRPCAGMVDTEREGFPGMTAEEFIEMFCKHMGGPTNQTVTRIEFEYTEEPWRDASSDRQ